MSLDNNAILDGFSILLLLILCFHCMRRDEDKSAQTRLYIEILLLTMFMLILDIFSRTDGYAEPFYPFTNHVCNFLLFLLSPLVPSIWLSYVTLLSSNSEKKMKGLRLPLFIVNAANLILLLASQKTGWYYFIDSGNIYHRGPLFGLSALITVSLMIVSYVIILHYRNNISKKQLLSISVFPLPPLACIIFQVFIYGISIVLNGLVLSLLIVLLNMQNDTIYTDFLTGVGNRKKLEAVLKDCIRRSSSRRTFSLIMLDIDDFKEINDNFGHDMGDRALKASAELLRKCVRSKDYVIRFGGDEFCLVAEIYEKSRVEAMLDRINNHVDQYNASGHFPFNLSFTMGYSVFDCTSGMNQEGFIKQVDMLMYENKRLKKNKD